MSQICENNAVVQDFSINNTESRKRKPRAWEGLLGLQFQQYGLYCEIAVKCNEMTWGSRALLSSKHLTTY